MGTMIDYEPDGLGDSMDITARIVGMEGMRFVEAVVHRLTEMRREDAARSADRARELTTQYEANAALARRDLAPVLRDDWWDNAGLDTIREKYATALAFSRVDDRFQPVRERIEERARTLHDAGPEQILAGVVRPGPQPMTEPQMAWAMNNVTPDWYKAYAADRTSALDKIKDPGARMAAQLEHTRQVQHDLEHWRDHGTLSTNAQDVHEQWWDGSRRSREWKNVDRVEQWTPLTDEQRHSLGWRPGGPRIVAPLSVDDARLVAATAAPGWYRVQDLVASDVPPAVRERLESRLVEDMTQLRDSGRLDTPSAREEWARFSGHPLSVEQQDPNESLTDFTARKEEAFASHWLATEHDREHVSAPHGEHVGKPMSVAEAEEFAAQYAPFWLRERHDAVLAEAGQHADPERAAFEQTSVREQFRYAMETARDTGGLGHPYAQALRSQAAMLGVDEEEGMRHVPSGERARYGGPAARPMSEAESLEVMRGWAPEWYRDQVNRTLRENTMIGEAGRRVELDAVRADMTEFRDRGVLATDHAKRLWAASQPDFDPSHYDSRAAMDRREQLWVETMGTRPGVEPMDANNRERFGGVGAREPEAVTQPVPVVERPAARKEVHEMYYDEEPPSPAQRPQARPEPTPEPSDAPVTDWPTRTPPAPAESPKGPPYDSVTRREREAAQLRGRGRTSEEVAAKTVEDYGYPSNPSKRKGGKPGGKPEWFDQRREAARMSPPTPGQGKGPSAGR